MIPRQGSRLSRLATAWFSRFSQGMTGLSAKAGNTRSAGYDVNSNGIVRD